MERRRREGLGSSVLRRRMRGFRWSSEEFEGRCGRRGEAGGRQRMDSRRGRAMMQQRRRRSRRRRSSIAPFSQSGGALPAHTHNSIVHVSPFLHMLERPPQYPGRLAQRALGYHRVSSALQEPRPLSEILPDFHPEAVKGFVVAGGGSGSSG
jgi:hypothetical protein